MKTHALVLVPLLALLFIAANALAQRAPGASAVLGSAHGPQGTVCTSTDGQSTCSCAAKCQAKAASCQCYGIPPASDAAQRSPGHLLGPDPRRKAVCTSGDGKKTCACGDKGCNATPIGCGCLTD